MLDGGRVLPLLLGPALVALLLPPAAAPPAAASAAGPAPVPRGGTASGSGWRAPLDDPLVLLRRFDPPERVWGPGHRGVDLAASPGTAVRAAGAGVVAFAADLAGRGVVVVVHDGGLRTTYEPVDVTVAVGDTVGAGALLGSIGAGAAHCGRVPTCLHWGLRRGRDYLDPWLLLDRGRPVLLPAAPP